MFKPDGSRGLEYYVNTDFTGGWDKVGSGNSELVLSRTRYALIYTKCLVLFYSKL